MNSYGQRSRLCEKFQSLEVFAQKVPTIGSFSRKTSRHWNFLLFAALLLTSSGCATYDACHARFAEPDYLVTRRFFTEVPQRVVILPFAARRERERDVRNAQVCRTTFYQHFAVQSFEDVDLCRVDKLLNSQQSESETLVDDFLGIVRGLDVVGITSLLELQPFFGKRHRRYHEIFRSLVETVAGQELQADAYVLGISRSYGRVYAVLASSIALSTRLEMRSVTDDGLLWRADGRHRNMAAVLTINPLAIPNLLVDVWKNSRGRALTLLAYQVYGDVVATMPDLDGPVEPYVETSRKKTPWFRKPSLFRLLREGHLPPGRRLPFIMEKRGWYQCEGPDGKPVWIFRSDARLTDADGRPLAGARPGNAD